MAQENARGYTGEMIGNDAGGIAVGQEAVSITLTVIGGTSSGKTTLVSAFAKEFADDNETTLRFVPVAPEKGTAGTTTNRLDTLQDLIYKQRRFPIGDVNCSAMPLQLNKIVNGKPLPIARINLLDYPGGVLAGMKTLKDTPEYEVFWRRVEHSDGLVLIADASDLRLKLNAKDWDEVRENYQIALERLAQRNGSKRVVPVALALTKCDEYTDTQSGTVKEDLLIEDFKNPDYKYVRLEKFWRENSTYGQYRIFTTSAVTHTVPEKTAFGVVDKNLPYGINMDKNVTIKPSGCAAPFLWLIASMLRHNITLFRDLRGFLQGGAAREFRVQEAVQDLELMARKSEAFSFLPRIPTSFEEERRGTATRRY